MTAVVRSRRFTSALPFSAPAGLAVVLATGGGYAAADTAEIPSARDNTIYSEAADYSNGAGSHFFAGQTDSGNDRRGLIAFDVAGAVPAGSAITTVTLQLYMSRTTAGNESVSLFRVQTDCGEGTSDAPGGEGGGTLASDGDATWVYTFYDTSDPPGSPAWGTAGGDYDPAVSAVAVVGNLGSYSWGSTARMVADVQLWLDDPVSNFGWLVMGEEGSNQTTKRFDTRENATEGYRPVLTVTYAPPVCPADANGDGFVNVLDLVALLLCFGDPAIPGCVGEDINEDGNVNVLDLVQLLLAFGTACP